MEEITEEEQRLKFYISLIDFYENIVEQQLKLNRELINYLKKEKEPVELYKFKDNLQQ